MRIRDQIPYIATSLVAAFGGCELDKLQEAGILDTVQSFLEKGLLIRLFNDSEIIIASAANALSHLPNNRSLSAFDRATTDEEREYVNYMIGRVTRTLEN